jgi:hypothetical protein
MSEVREYIDIPNGSSSRAFCLIKANFRVDFEKFLTYREKVKTLGL